MTNRFVFSMVLLASLCIAVVSCSVPRRIWPQKDIETGEQGGPSSANRVLVASRSSEFKDAVVNWIRKDLSKEEVYVKFIGLDQLKNEDGTAYDAVVLINTCMVWGMDRHVSSFLKRHEDQGNMIVLTTSGDGNWLPDAEGRTFDAISSASEKTKIDEVGDTIMVKVRALLSREED